MKPLTFPLLNGRANSDVTTPHSAKKTTSMTITAPRPERRSILSALSRSYAAASAAPRAIDAKK